MNQFKEVNEGVFIGPQPTEDDLHNAKRQGIRTVIDFRLPAETATSNETLTKNAGLDYANIPVDKANLSMDQIDRLDNVMKSKKGPFLLHCGTGTRAALLYSLNRAKQQGWMAEQTFDEAKRMGFDLKTSPEFSAFVTKATA
jgi:uncharacterized protein (TIGR01244 family)